MCGGYTFVGRFLILGTVCAYERSIANINYCSAIAKNECGEDSNDDDDDLLADGGKCTRI